MPAPSAIGSTKTLRRLSGLDHSTAMHLAATEYDRWAVLAGQIAPDEWQRPTDCAAWDVRQLVAHVVGMTEMWAGPLELLHQLRVAGRAGVDALTDLQVRERAAATPAELVARLRTAGPKAARWRHRLHRITSRRLLTPQQELPMDAGLEWWSFNYLIDTILTRDPWMHRVDLSRATGRPMTLTPEHDGAIVADVVAEWGQRHGRPYRLHLTGPAGGKWEGGAATADVALIESDALEFCRSISGRDPGTGLLRVSVPF